MVKKFQSEPLLSREKVEAWFVDSDQAIKVDGEIVLIGGEDVSHLALAGLTIVQSREPKLLSEAYGQLPDHPNQLSTNALADIAHGIDTRYTPEESSA